MFFVHRRISGQSEGHCKERRSNSNRPFIDCFHLPLYSTFLLLFLLLFFFLDNSKHLINTNFFFYIFLQRLTPPVTETMPLEAERAETVTTRFYMNLNEFAEIMRFFCSSIMNYKATWHPNPHTFYTVASIKIKYL